MSLRALVEFQAFRIKFFSIKASILLI